MPKTTKQTRKRKNETNIEIVVDVPKAKFKTYNKKAQEEDEELSRILFGGATNFLQSLEEAEKEPGTSNVDSGVGEESDECDDRKPAWIDEEDDGIDVGDALSAQNRKLPLGGINTRQNKYSDLLKHKFTSLVGTPSWANLDKPKHVEDSDSDEEILGTCGFIRGGKSSTTLASTTVEFKKVKDLNCETYSEGPYINSVEFMNSSSVALVAGQSGIATLYAVDGRRNNKLHSIQFQNFPVQCAKFIQDSNEAVLGSKHAHMFTYDLMAAKSARVPLPKGLNTLKKFIISPDNKFIAAVGKWGEIHLLTSKSKERVSILKQGSEVTALAFNDSGSLLYGHSDIGEITVWDMKMGRVKHTFQDEGCLSGSTLSISPSNQFLASGSGQGVVNIYGIEDIFKNKLPKPRKTILNLTTAITDLKFNPTSEMLALSSVHIPNSVKLFHVGSGTVFQNFPTFSTKFGNINVLNFSPSSGYIAFGNSKSTVSLYRLKHYKNY